MNEVNLNLDGSSGGKAKQWELLHAWVNNTSTKPADLKGPNTAANNIPPLKPPTAHRTGATLFRKNTTTVFFGGNNTGKFHSLYMFYISWSFPFVL